MRACSAQKIEAAKLGSSPDSQIQARTALLKKQDDNFPEVSRSARLADDRALRNLMLTVPRPVRPQPRTHLQIRMAVVFVGSMVTLGLVWGFQQSWRPDSTRGLNIVLLPGQGATMPACLRICRHQGLQLVTPFFDREKIAANCLKIAGDLSNSVFRTCLDAAIVSFEQTTPWVKHTCRQKGYICP